MAEKGYFQAQRGYWQTIGTPSAEILAGYPAGTVEVPLRPSADKMWDGSAWVTDPDYAAEALVDARKQAILPLGEVLGGMVEAGWLPEGAAEAWLDRTSLPGPLTAELASLPNPKTRLIARAALFAPTVWRLDPVWTRVFARFGKTDAEIDALFGVT